MKPKPEPARNHFEASLLVGNHLAEYGWKQPEIIRPLNRHFIIYKLEVLTPHNKKQLPTSMLQHHDITIQRYQYGYISSKYWWPIEIYLSSKREKKKNVPRFHGRQMYEEPLRLQFWCLGKSIWWNQGTIDGHTYGLGQGIPTNILEHTW